MLFPVTHCAGSQSTLLLALPLDLPQPWQCRHLVGLCFPQVRCSQSHQCRFVIADLLKCGTGITIVTRLDPLWELQHQSRPGACLHVLMQQIPQLLTPDLPQSREYH